MISGDKRKHVEDVAFQAQVLKNAYPEYRVTPFLCVANKTKHVTHAHTLGQFALEQPNASSASSRTVVHRG